MNLYKKNTVAFAINKYKYISKRWPINIIHLKNWVNHFLKREFSSSAIRNILLSEFYKFNYFYLKEKIYMPKELISLEDGMKIIIGKNKFCKSGISLSYQMGLSNQNVSQESIIIFGKYDEKRKYLLDFFPRLKFEILDVTNYELIEDIILLIKIMVFLDYPKKYENYILENNINKKTLLDIYQKYSNGKFKFNTNNSLKNKEFDFFGKNMVFSNYFFTEKKEQSDIFDNKNNEIEFILMKGILYAKK